MWQSYDIKTAQDLDIRLNNFRVLFAYNSAKIENTEVSFHVTRDIFENAIVNDFSGNPDTITEINNQRKCYTLLLPKITTKEPLTLELIKDTHEVTTMGTYDDCRFFDLGERPGEFKKNDFVVGKDEVGSLPEHVHDDMTELLDEMNDIHELKEPKNVFKAATYFHMRFGCIHPFADGNGRVGRTMMNYFLMTHNHPPLIVYAEDSGRYYEALEYYGATEDIEPLHLFFKQQLEKTWMKTPERKRTGEKQ